MDRCPGCGASLALVGRAHNCRAVNTAVNKPKSAVNRGKYPNNDHRRAYMRDYMRKRRSSNA